MCYDRHNATISRKGLKARYHTLCDIANASRVGRTHVAQGMSVEAAPSLTIDHDFQAMVVWHFLLSHDSDAWLLREVAGTPDELGSGNLCRIDSSSS